MISLIVGGPSSVKYHKVGQPVSNDTESEDEVYVKDDSKSDYSLYFREKVSYLQLITTSNYYYSLFSFYFHFTGDIVGIYSSELYNDWIDIRFCIL